MIYIEIPETVKKEVVLWETDRPSHQLELEAIVVTCKVACQVTFKRQDKDGKNSVTLISPVVGGYAPNAIIPLFRERIGGRQKLIAEVTWGTDTKTSPISVVLIHTRN